MHQQNLTFLEKFPSLREWLSLNGFWVVHATTDLRIRTHITMWTDQCRADDGTPEPSDSDTFLVITHCEECKTVEVYVRGFIGKSTPEGSIPFSLRSFDKEIVSNKIEQILREIE